ncbi:MAG: hypothetical protein ABIH41_06095 [Nanoarchaeota archaeon]
MDEGKKSTLVHYAWGLSIGFVIILFVGLGRIPTGDVTGYAVYDQPDRISGNAVSAKIISFNCQLTPQQIVVSRGDRVELYATQYGDTSRTHIISVPEYDVDIRVLGNDLRRAEFYATKAGRFVIQDDACERMGTPARAMLIVK